MREALKEMIIGAGYEVTEQEVFKGSAKMTGWVIKSEASNVAPTIYISEFDDMDDEEAFERIMNLVERNPEFKFDRDMLLWSNVKDKVFLGIRRELPEDENTITQKVLDMELTVKIPIDRLMEDGMASVTLNKSTLQFIQENEPYLTVEDIFETAKRNTEYCGPSNLGLPDFILETLNIITNTKSLYGASVFGNADYLAEYCKGKGYNEMYILPSSVHEVLCMFDPELSVDELRTMVRTVNATEVAPQEQLSDNVYYFNAETRELKIA